MRYHTPVVSVHFIGAGGRCSVVHSKLRCT